MKYVKKVFLLIICLIWSFASVQSNSAENKAHFCWPVKGNIKILRSFDHSGIDYYSGHRGTDIYAPPGTKVYAPSSGIILLNRKVFTRNVTLIDHLNGYVSTLESIDSSLKVGTYVNMGDYLGTTNNYQIHSLNSLYWGVRKDDEIYVDPVLLVNNVFARLVE